jgi:DNA-directed RNA polymerase beta' subunit
MLIDIADINEYIKSNNLKEIKTNNIFQSSSSRPDVEGIGSYEIFGNPGTRERKMTFAYIDLGDDFINPTCFDTLVALKPALKDVIRGFEEFYVLQGKIIKVTDKTPPPSGADVGTGVAWLKRNLKKIVLEKSEMSSIVKDRINFIKSMSENEMYCNKWLVIPPYYRDIDISVHNKKNDINIMYQSLIAQTTMIKATGSLFKGGVTTDAHRKIQDKINEIYLYFMGFQAGTKAFIQQHVMGKAIDYSSRMVISTPKIRAKNSREMEVSFSHSAVPLAMALECFAPYIVYGLKKFVNQKIGGSNYIYKYENKEFKRIELASHWSEILLSENIKKMIKVYTDSKERRLDTFLIETASGEKVPLGYVTRHLEMSVGSVNNIEKGGEEGIRPLTICEIMYIVALNTIKEKSILITRYPIEDYHSIYPSLMNIIPFDKTGKVEIDGEVYPRFPLIAEEDINDPSIGSKFIDTFRIFPSYSGFLLSDYDGDTVSIQGVFTKDSGANGLIFSKSNIVNIGGGTMHNISDITSHSIYALTRRLEKIA